MYNYLKARFILLKNQIISHTSDKDTQKISFQKKSKHFGEAKKLSKIAKKFEK
jgi:hypothetical protein